MTDDIVLIGVPTALGGHLGGMDLAPAGLRELGLIDRVQSRPGLAGTSLRDAGDLAIVPGFREDPDPRAKNRSLIAEFLPREKAMVAAALADGGDGSRLFIVGGDCTSHPGALAGFQAVRPGRRLAMAWFDAHGDYNTPDTTPSGNVWGMPFAMACGKGEPDLVGACDGPTVRPTDCALLGGQVLDEQESRMLASDGVAQFGSGMLATEAGLAGLAGWAEAKAGEVDGVYIAIDFDVLDAAGRWAVQMPEPDGLSLETALAAVRTLAGAMPVVGFGATGVNLANGDPAVTVEAVVLLAEAALAR